VTTHPHDELAGITGLLHLLTAGPVDGLVARTDALVNAMQGPADWAQGSIK
jgi:hypothetical protein